MLPELFLKWQCQLSTILAPLPAAPAMQASSGQAFALPCYVNGFPASKTAKIYSGLEERDWNKPRPVLQASAG